MLFRSGAPLLLVGIIVAAFIGAMIGAKIVKKHTAADSAEEQNEF